MKRIIIAALSIVAAISGATAQENLKLLNVQETTDGIGVYPCGSRHEAKVVFVTSEPFGLAFESSHDRADQLNIQVDSMAGKKTYSIVFVTQAPGVNYSKRRITIKVPGFQDYRMALPLQDKELFEYTVSDPYSILRSPFFTYLEKAQAAFKEADYQSARDNYELCRYCPEYKNDADRIDEHINNCDSMMYWDNMATQAEHFFKYHEAQTYLQKMQSYNNNNDLRTRLFKVQSDFRQDCQALLEMGERQLNNGNLERAEGFFRQIQENGCVEFTSRAEELLIDLHKARQRRDDHARTFMLQYSPTMFGISGGSYYQQRSHGWYTTFMTNFDAFKLATLRPDEKNFCKTDDNGNVIGPADDKFIMEVVFATGPTWHIAGPVYIHAGVGYHGGGFCNIDDEKLKEDKVEWSDQTTALNKLKYTKINWLNSAAPEIGLVLKYGRFAVKGTYQYSYWFNQDYQELCDKNIHGWQVGVGFCW